MPLFKCDRCDCIDNTALGAYWHNKAEGMPVLCAECATGRWHGQFPKAAAQASGYVQRPDGFWEWRGQSAPVVCSLCNGTGRRRCTDLMCQCMTDFHRCHCNQRNTMV